MLDKATIEAERKKNEQARLAAKNKAGKVVEVEKIVEKIVEKEVRVEVPVEVEKIVEKIVEKEVRVEVPVEVPVDGLVPVEGTADHTKHVACDDFYADKYYSSKDWTVFRDQVNKSAELGPARVLIVVEIPKGGSLL